MQVVIKTKSMRMMFRSFRKKRCSGEVVECTIYCCRTGEGIIRGGSYGTIMLLLFYEDAPEFSGKKWESAEINGTFWDLFGNNGGDESL